jgi:hypothetical protein
METSVADVRHWLWVQPVTGEQWAHVMRLEAAEN